MAGSDNRVEVWLYGKLRRFAPRREVSGNSIVHVPVEMGDTIRAVMRRIGIDVEETSNIFLNGELSSPGRRVRGGDRVGIFPRDQGLLYKWYFEKKE